MTTEHFNYEGNAEMASNIEIESVKFLVPVRIQAKVNGKSQSFIGQIDYVNRELYGLDALFCKEKLTEKTFAFLNNSTALPDDLYEAPSEVYEEAERAQKEKDNIILEIGE